jgi:pyruvate/2-oxoglutarate dehydrogenase complex dihydrolipoamide acyltransferase (E2) component
MATEVRLPQVGMGMTDGTVLEWIKGVGDSVRQGECIADGVPAARFLTAVVGRLEDPGSLV